MTIQWEKVHVFISSTFNDMHAERDYLVKQVFPELREWCEKRKLRLVDIDLRWGVTEQDALHNRNVVKICLERIDDCRPFFLCFLGQRRGWVPGEGDISSITLEEYPGLEKYVGDASVTEMEILHALVDPLHRGKVRDPKRLSEFYEPAKYAFFYLREDAYLEQLPADPPQLRQTYTNEGIEKEEERAQHDAQLKQWRDENIPATGCPARSYQVRWDSHLTTPELLLPLQCPSSEPASLQRWQKQWAKAMVAVTGDDVEKDPVQAEKAHSFNQKLSAGRLAGFRTENQPLSTVILDDLKAAITARYPDHVELGEVGDLQKEIYQQEQFLSTGSDGFIPRGNDFDELDAYVEDDSRQLLVLTAAGGMGKSTLLAKWIEQYRIQKGRRPGQSIHFRFIGQSDRSTTVYSLLRFLLSELKEVAGKIGEAIPDDSQKLRQELPKLLETAGKRGKTVIVLDALNQLESGLTDLAWLPYQLPENIKLIISFKRGEPSAEDLFQHMQGQVILSEVKPFENLEHRRALVNAYLDQYLKQLDEQHLSTLIHLPGAFNPLYLKVVLSELRVFGAFANLSDKIRSSFGETPISAFQGVLNRLENDPASSPIDPKQAVPFLFGLLAHVRQGLSIEDLTGLFVREFGSTQQDAQDTIHLYVRQMRPFLAHRDGRNDFFFESFKLAAQACYAGEATGQRLAEGWHRLLAEYFVEQPLIVEKKGKRHPNLNKLAEQPYQCTRANLWTDLYGTLTDFDFLEAKCHSYPVYDLETDFQVALENWQGEAGEKEVLASLVEQIRLETQAIQRFPELLFPQLYNDYLIVQNAQEAPCHTVIEQYAENHRGWLRVIRGTQPIADRTGNSPKNHTGAINTLVIASDNKTALSGSDDTTIKLWDIQTGQLIRTFEGQTTSVGKILLSPDGKTFLSFPGNLRLWDLQTGRLMRNMNVTGGARAAVYGPDGKSALTFTPFGTILWDLETGQAINSFNFNPFAFYHASISPDRKYSIAGFINADYVGSIEVWDLQAGEKKQFFKVFNGHADRMIVMFFSPDGSTIISKHADSFVRLWNPMTGELIRAFDIPDSSTETIAVSPDGKTVVSSRGLTFESSPRGVISHNTRLEVYDLQTGQLLRALEEEPDRDSLLGRTLAISPDNTLAICAWDRIRLWDLQTGKFLRYLTVGDAAGNTGTGKITSVPSEQVPRSIRSRKGRLVDLAISPDNKTVITSEEDNTIKLWSLPTGQLLHSFEEHKTYVNPIAVSPNETVMAGIAAELTRWRVFLWDLQTRQLRHTLQIRTRIACPIALSRDGKTFFSSLPGNMIRRWDLTLSWQTPPNFEGHVKPVTSLVLSPDEKTIISGSEDKTIKIWDVETRSILRSLEGHYDGVNSLALSGDGKTLVSCSDDRTIKVWDLDIGTIRRSLEGHTEPVNSLALSGDGKTLVSCSDDRTIKVWDLDTGTIWRSLEGHTEPVNSVALSPDGKTLVSGSDDRTIKVWDLDIGTIRRSLEGHTEPVNSVALSPDGKTLISGSDDKTVNLWNIETGQVLQNFVGSALPIYSVVFTVDGNTVLGGSHLFHINSWKIQDGQRNPGWALASSNTKAVFSPNSDFVVIQALDNSLNVWEVNTGQLLHSFVGHTNWVKDWFFSLDGTMVISTSEDKTIKCWDVQSGKLINSIEGLVEVRLIPFSDAKRIVCVNSSESTVIRDLETGQILGSYEGLATHVTADGKLFVNRNLLSYSRGTLVDLITGEVRSLQGGILFQHAVTDDLASIGHEDRFIKRWDLQVGEVQALFANSGGVKHLKVSKDGHWLVCSNGLEVFIFEWIK